MFAITFIHALVCLGSLLAWRRVGQHSVPKATMEALHDVDRRSLYSGNFGKGTRRRKIGDQVRAFAGRVFIASAIMFGLALLLSTAIFGLTLIAHMMIVLLSGGTIDIAYLAEKTRTLALGFANAASFDALMIFNFDHDLTEPSVEARIINFVFLFSLVMIAVNAIIGILWNVVALIVAIVLPVSFVRAADPDIVIERNTRLERLVFHALDFGGVDRRAD